MQLFTSNGIGLPRPPARSGYKQSSSRLRSGESGLHRRNENGLLAVVERHRDAVRRGSALPPPADPAR
ncbi:MAG TPA: hypothetical protein VK827_04285 [Lysobacter sp.]|nr:hypothetical protein [Lysobacter sp.]